MRTNHWLAGASLILLACGTADPGTPPPDPRGTQDPNNPNNPNNPNDPNDPNDPNKPMEPVEMPPLADGVSTLAGYSTAGDADGPRGYGMFDNPVNVLFAGTKVFVADFYNGRIATITPEGAVSTAVRQDGFDRPFGMVALDSTTLLIQTDRTTTGSPNGALWRFDTVTQRIALIGEDIGRPPLCANDAETVSRPEFFVDRGGGEGPKDDPEARILSPKQA